MKTRAAKAEELLRLATDGPSFSLGFPRTNPLPVDVASKEARDSYRLWASSWLLPLLHDLVPEFKGLDKINEAMERASRMAK